MTERKEKIIERRDKGELGVRGKEQKEIAYMNNRVLQMERERD